MFCAVLSSIFIHNSITQNEKNLLIPPLFQSSMSDDMIESFSNFDEENVYLLRQNFLKLISFSVVNESK